MNKKLSVVNSYRLTQIDKYIAERKEEYINCKNKSNISSFHYEKLIDDIEKILRSFPDEQFSQMEYRIGGRLYGIMGKEKKSRR